MKSLMREIKLDPAHEGCRLLNMKLVSTANCDFKGAAPGALLLAATLFLLPAAADWEQPSTTRRYLHPPMVNCMYTFWNDGKIMRGENRHRQDWKIGFHELMADVMWVFHVEDEKPFDFKASENRLP